MKLLGRLELTSASHKGNLILDIEKRAKLEFLMVGRHLSGRCAC